MRRKDFNWAWVVLIAAPMVGCSDSGLDLAPVTGVVLYDGEKLEKAGVVFRPGDGPIATGVTDAEGRFHLVTGKYDGALIGTHTITVSKVKIETGDSPEEPTIGPKLSGGPARGYRGPKAPESMLPDRYSRSKLSGLKETVQASDNDFLIELNSKPTK